MRISTSNMFDAGIATLQRRQQQLQETQVQLTSGKRVAQASDDPTGAARAERAMAAQGRIDTNQRALEASRNNMTLAEGALGDASTLMQQVREAMVAAGNSSYTDAERLGLADTIAGLRDQLLAVANRSDGSGGYIFAGQGSPQPPFLDQPGGVTFNGTAGAVGTGNIDKFPLTIDGALTWEQARTGNGSFETGSLGNTTPGVAPKSWIDAGRVLDPAAVTGDSYSITINGNGVGATYDIVNTTTGAAVASAPFSSGKSISFDGLTVTLNGQAQNGDQFEIKPSTVGLKLFDVLDRAVTNLRTSNRSGTAISQANALALRDLDAVSGGLQHARSQVGAQLNNLDGSENRLSAQKLYNQSEQSAATDLDMVQGISDFQNQQTGYDAALKTYSMVQRLSLFQYINA